MINKNAIGEKLESFGRQREIHSANENDFGVDRLLWTHDIPTCINDWADEMK